MNKSEFIAAMEAQLIRLPKADRDDILNDYESHFVNGVAEGRTEEEVSASLGDPIELAAVYLENLPEGSKGDPYIPSEPAAEEQSATTTPEAENAWRTATAGQGTSGTQTTAATSSEPSAGGIVAVVLLTLFVALPVVWTIAGAILGTFGVTIGGFAGAVALVALAITSMGLSVVGGVGLLLLAVSVAALGVLALFLGILAIKGTIWLGKWYVDCCKKMIGGNN